MEIYHVSANRWRLERREGGWTVAEQVTRLLGHTEGLKPFSGAGTGHSP
jgi:hypothetical protein